VTTRWIVPGSGSGTISDITSSGGTITVTNATGPTTNVDIPTSYLASPPAIGGTTPAAISTTILTATSGINLTGTGGLTANGLYKSATNQLSLSTNSVIRWTVDANGNFYTKFATADQSYSLQTPTTGFSITIANYTSTLILNPAGTLASGTITMPASPIDGQIVQVSSSQTVTALTVSPNTGQTLSGAPTTITATAGFRYIYNLSGTNWYRIN
jgi:hypothetical protein